MTQTKAPATACANLTVSVTFFADLRRFLPAGADGPQRYSVPAGATVSDLLGVIGVDEAADVTVAMDGELARRETPLRDGADVMLLSPMEGGAPAAGEARLSGPGRQEMPRTRRSNH